MSNAPIVFAVVLTIAKVGVVVEDLKSKMTSLLTATITNHYYCYCYWLCG